LGRNKMRVGERKRKEAEKKRMGIGGKRKIKKAKRVRSGKDGRRGWGRRREGARDRG